METLDGLKLRLHQGQVSFDQLADWYWDKEHENAELRKERLVILADLQESFQIRHGLKQELADLKKLVGEIANRYRKGAISDEVINHSNLASKIIEELDELLQACTLANTDSKEVNNGNINTE